MEFIESEQQLQKGLNGPVECASILVFTTAGDWQSKKLVHHFREHGVGMKYGRYGANSLKALNIRIYRIDVDLQWRLVNRFGITGVPSMLFLNFKNETVGKVRGLTLSGDFEEPLIEAFDSFVEVLKAEKEKENASLNRNSTIISRRRSLDSVVRESRMPEETLANSQAFGSAITIGSSIRGFNPGRGSAHFHQVNRASASFKRLGVSPNRLGGKAEPSKEVADARDKKMEDEIQVRLGLNPKTELATQENMVWKQLRRLEEDPRQLTEKEQAKRVAMQRVSFRDERRYPPRLKSTGFIGRVQDIVRRGQETIFR